MKIKSALSNKTGEGYIDTAVKMIIAVVLGSLLLTGLYQLFIKKRALPTHVPLDNEELEKNSLALLEQIRTIDKSRLIRKIGRVPEEKMKEIGAAIHVSLDLNDEDEQHIDASG